MSNHRWQAGSGPAKRRLSPTRRVKRWLVEWAIRDRRIRRLALNRLFTNHGAEGILCLVPFGDHKVFVDPRDDRIAYTLLTGRAWQRQHLEAAIDASERAGRFTPGGVFIDVGANIGLITLYALLSGRFERAIAIEPDPWNRQILEQNLEINGLTGRVDVLAMAASDKAGTMNLHRDAKNLGAHSLEPGFSMSPVAEPYEVSVARVDELVRDAGVAAADVSFVKIDVEGHEFSVLAGLSGLLGAAPPPIMIEVTFDAGDAGADAARLKALLGDYSQVVDIDRPGRGPLSLDAFKPTSNQHELVIF